MHEFALIDRIRKQFSQTQPEVLLGIGDDCALLTPRATLAVSTDTFVEGTHFFKGTSARAIGHKALAVNLSDLAAMGAKPLYFLLNLTLPNTDESFAHELLAGIHALAALYQCALIGGDTTRGPLSITITVFGECPADKALRRSAAKAGDEIFVTRKLGAAAAAVYARKQNIKASTALCKALDFPDPQIALGMALRGVASAAIDLSDGLVNDLSHICEQSALAATLQAEDIPVSPAIDDLPGINAQQALQFAVNGGDDYALCFCASPLRREELHAICANLDLELFHIGVMYAKSDASQGSVQVWHGAELLPIARGFQHF
jgi:thiamine-monophosphate kinase